MLTQRRILHYIPQKKTPYIIYTRERQEKNRLHFSKEVYEDRKESYAKRIESMIEYASAEENCRSRMLLRYFGEKNEHNCGQCDVCLQKRRKEISKEERLKLQKEILDILKKGQLTTATLIHAIQGDKEIAHEVISFLLAEEIIHLKNGMLYL